MAYHKREGRMGVCHVEERVVACSAALPVDVLKEGIVLLSRGRRRTKLELSTTTQFHIVRQTVTSDTDHVWCRPGAQSKLRKSDSSSSQNVHLPQQSIPDLKPRPLPTPRTCIHCNLSKTTRILKRLERPRCPPRVGDCSLASTPQQPVTVPAAAQKWSR